MFSFRLGVKGLSSKRYSLINEARTPRSGMARSVPPLFRRVFDRIFALTCDGKFPPVQLSLGCSPSLSSELTFGRFGRETAMTCRRS